MLTVSQLITALEKLPGDAKVGYVWDGDVRSEVEYVWLSRSGMVVLDNDCYVADPQSRPEGTPTDAGWWVPSDTFGS